MKKMAMSLNTNGKGETGAAPNTNGSSAEKASSTLQSSSDPRAATVDPSVNPKETAGVLKCYYYTNYHQPEHSSFVAVCAPSRYSA